MEAASSRSRRLKMRRIAALTNHPLTRRRQLRELTLERAAVYSQRLCRMRNVASAVLKDALDVFPFDPG